MICGGIGWIMRLRRRFWMRMGRRRWRSCGSRRIGIMATEISYKEGLKKCDERLMGKKVGKITPGGSLTAKVKRTFGGDV